MRVRSGHLQGNLALGVCEPPCGECAVQRQILSPGGYQGEGISVPHMRAEMGSPWSAARPAAPLRRQQKTPPPGLGAEEPFVRRKIRRECFCIPGDWTCKP